MSRDEMDARLRGLVCLCRFRGVDVHLVDRGYRRAVCGSKIGNQRNGRTGRRMNRVAKGCRKDEIRASEREEAKAMMAGAAESAQS